MASIFSRMGRSLYYYRRDSGLEIDFVLRYKGECTLIEAKATTGNAKSLTTILKQEERYHEHQGIKLGDCNVGRQGNILTLPLYMAFLLRVAGRGLRVAGRGLRVAGRGLRVAGNEGMWGLWAEG